MTFTERFIYLRAEKTEHLRNLAKAERFYWGQKEENEFTFLKSEALKTITKLGFFKHTDETELYVDASPIGLGAVLIQYNDAKIPRIIGCASKALSETERKYPQTQRESLAMVWGVERFAFYLLNKAFVIRTDSEANKFIFGDGCRMGKRAISRAEAWALRLQSYDFKVKCIAGESNVADVLSRLIAKTQIDEPFDEDNDKHLLFALDAGTMDVTWKDIDLASEEDYEITSIQAALKSGKWPKELYRFEAHAKELRMLGPKVFKSERLVLPKSLRLKVLKTAHRGHIGCAAMKRILREFFWWPGLSDSVESFVKSCTTCLMITKRNPPIPLSSRKLPEGPWEVLQIDFLSLPGCGFGEFLIVVDTYSRYLVAVEMKCTDAKSTNAALSKIFFTWGLPLVVQSDNGPPFKSTEFVEYWTEKGVTVRKSIPLCPQSNGAVERQNQGLIKAVAGARQDGENCKDALNNYVHVHNTIKPHSRLGVTPFELLVGWKYRGTYPCLWEKKTDKIDKEEIRDRDAESKLVNNKYADFHRGAKRSNIAAGDRVLVAVSKKSKTDPQFSSEKFTVLSREGGKVVIRSDRGVQYSRSIRNVKLIPNFENDTENEEIEAEEAGNLDKRLELLQRQEDKAGSQIFYLELKVGNMNMNNY